MFDTMTLTKVSASLCAALLVYLVGNWVASAVYETASYGSEQAYVIEVEGAEVAEAEPEIDFDMLMASADVEKGSKVFRKCSACHKLEAGANAAGPYLHNVVGRDVAAADGFAYSGALVAVADVWSVENLNGFLENPKGYAPGTSMGFAGLGKPQDRANVIAYLETITN